MPAGCGPASPKAPSWTERRYGPIDQEMYIDARPGPFKYLGVWVDPMGTWEEQIKELRALLGPVLLHPF